MAEAWDVAAASDALVAMLQARAPDVDTLKARHEAGRRAVAERNARRRRRDAGTQPTPTDTVFRAQAALPPPHLAITRREIEAEERRRTSARDRAQRLTGYPDAAILPSWVYRVAARIHAGLEEVELRQLPQYNAERIRLAASWARTEHARRSTIALGVCLTWLSMRRPSRCGTPSTIAGIPHAMLLRLTRTRDGGHYSESAVFHGHHGRVDGDARGPYGGVWGDPDAGQLGMLPALQLAGALHVWIPPSDVEPWMRGPSGYAYACIRARMSAPETDDAWWALQTTASARAAPPPPS